MTNAIVIYKGLNLATATTADLVRATDRHLRNLFKVADGDDKAAAKKAREDIESYLTEQQELFESKRLDKARAYNEAIIPTGETLPNGCALMRIVKRNFCLQQSVDLEDGIYSVSATSRTKGESVLSPKGGKYNDVDRLFLNEYGTVEVGETASWTNV